MAITTAQIRGARAMLNWTQDELAERSGLTSNSIGSIEAGASSPREKTLNEIRKAFETNGIEFMGLDGVRYRTGNVRTYTGKQGIRDFYDDIYETLKEHKGDVFVSNVDERIFVDTLGDYAPLHIERMTSLMPDISFRILVKEGDDYTPGSDYGEYRAIPEELFASVPFYAYGPKLAIMLFKKQEPVIIVMDYPEIKEAYRVQFEDMWERAKEL